MPVTQIFGGFGVESQSTLIGGISQYDLGSGTNVANEVTSGQVYPEFLSITAQKPVTSFTTLQIARALGVCGLTGLAITGTGLKYYLQKHEEGATRDSTSVHRKLTINKGIIVPRTLTCDHQGDAELSYDVVVTYDGSNDPVVINDSVAVPSGLADDERFTLGPATIGAISMPQIRQLQIDFGVNAVSEGADSDIWDRYVSIRDIKPMLTLRGIDPTWFAAASIPLIGKAATHANTSIYLRKREEGATLLADATAQHVKFTADGMATIETIARVGGGEPSETVLTMPLDYDGTNDPLVIDTAIAVT